MGIIQINETTHIIKMGVMESPNNSKQMSLPHFENLKRTSCLDAIDSNIELFVNLKQNKVKPRNALQGKFVRSISLSKLMDFLLKSRPHSKSSIIK